MKLLFDFLPIIVFFIAYKFFGIFVATTTLLAFTAIQFGWVFWKKRSFDTTQIIVLASVILLGGATLLFHNTLFIKWKPTALYWIMALVFIFAPIINKKTLLEKMLDEKLSLPRNIWNRLNLAWVFFFLSIGTLNLYVVYHFSTNAWVNFKLFGVLGATLLFGILQSLYMAKYLKDSCQKQNLE